VETQLAAILWPGSYWLLAAALIVAIAAGAVRGYAGFGFSALVVAALAPFVTPGPLVLTVLMLEMAASAQLMRTVSGEVDRDWHRTLVLGNLVCVPFGVAALVWMSPGMLRLVVGASLLIGSLVLRATVGLTLRSTPVLRLLAGTSSGVLNGLAASGGIMAALLFAATSPAPSVLRATMISFLLWISAYVLLWSVALSFLGGSLFLGAETLRWVMVLAPGMWLGMRLGALAFHRASPERQRITVLNILIATAAISLAVAVARH
jgi:uncharacterized protein